MISLRKLLPESSKQRAVQEQIASKQRAVRELIATFGAHLEHTPDYPYLETREWQYFLIYDGMMRGHREASLLDGSFAQFCGLAYTADRFVMAKKVLGKATFPIAFDPKDAVNSPKSLASRLERAPIRGELYRIRPYHIKDVLDKARLNTVQFERRRVQLDIPFQEVIRKSSRLVDHKGKVCVEVEDVITDWQHFKSQYAWMYFGIHQHFYWSNFVGHEQDFLAPVTPLYPNKRQKVEDEISHLTQRLANSNAMDGTTKRETKERLERVLKDDALRLSPYYLYTVNENVF